MLVLLLQYILSTWHKASSIDLSTRLKKRNGFPHSQKWGGWRDPPIKLLYFNSRDFSSGAWPGTNPWWRLKPRASFLAYNQLESLLPWGRRGSGEAHQLPVMRSLRTMFSWYPAPLVVDLQGWVIVKAGSCPLALVSQRLGNVWLCHGLGPV